MLSKPAAMLSSSSACGAEVYLGKWHGCDAAIKCLNPGLFFGGGDVQNHAAVADLVKEADILGRCATLPLLIDAATSLFSI